MKRKSGQETNLELVVDNIARVVETIDNSREMGAGKINGLVWTARSVDGSIVEVDELVLVKEIKGNKLIVEKKIGGQ
jgi:membrane protein implicated in regulation of membrane protease activity